MSEAGELLEPSAWGTGCRTIRCSCRGEQQRVAVARAFACRPPILLADEPTGNFDSSTGRHVIELIMALHRDAGTTLVLVTHDSQLAATLERVITIRDGRIASDQLTGCQPSQPDSLLMMPFGSSWAGGNCGPPGAISLFPGLYCAGCRCGGRRLPLFGQC